MKGLIKKILLVVTALIFLFAVAFLLLWKTNQKVKSVNNNSQHISNINQETQQSNDDSFIYSKEGNNAILSFPYSGFKVTIPVSYLSFGEKELQSINDKNGEYSLWHSCKYLYKESDNTMGFWVSFAQQDNLCGTERFLSLVAEPVFQATSTDFCEEINQIVNHSNCQKLLDTPPGFEGYSFYEYIPEFGMNNNGMIVKEVFLRFTASPEKKIIFGYVPIGANKIYIKQGEFSKYMKDIQAGEISIFENNNISLIQFNGIVKSLQYDSSPS